MISRSRLGANLKVSYKDVHEAFSNVPFWPLILLTRTAQDLFCPLQRKKREDRERPLVG